jgi:hypothetical protein
MPPVKDLQDGEDAAFEDTTAGNEEQICTPLPCSSYLDWWYRSSTEWVLWCVIASKQSDRGIHDKRTLPSRVDSGIALNVLDQSAPDPLSFTFHLDDRTYTKTLDYQAFVQWDGVSALLDELYDDGIMVNQLWDVNEYMEVGSGDWEARVRPGWKVDVYCQHSDQCEPTSDWISDYESDDSDGEEDKNDNDDLERMSNAMRFERRWWFARWKERVEKEKCRKAKTQQEPTWIMMLIWATSMVAFIAIVSVLAV